MKEKAYTLTSKEAAIIESFYTTYGKAPVPLLIRYLKCTHHKAEWIIRNIRTAEQLKEATYD